MINAILTFVFGTRAQFVHHKTGDVLYMTRLHQVPRTGEGAMIGLGRCYLVEQVINYPLKGVVAVELRPI